jgi:curved DNA-binding protein CbpA
MPDPFAALALPRRPWLEPAAIKEAFHRASAARHPDAPGGDAAAFAALNEAWRTLSDPASRLRHLLALEFPAHVADPAALPSTLMDFFPRIAALRQSHHHFLHRQKSAAGALGQALLAADRLALERELRRALTELEAENERALEKMRALDADWEQRTAATAECVAALQRRLTFLAKWITQLREAIFTLGG